MAWRGLTRREYWRGNAARFGGGAASQTDGTLWVHAVSVGEMQAAAPLIAELRARHPTRALWLTTATPTGRERARQLFGDDVTVRYAPYDLPWCIRRALARIRPAVCVVMEKELWPNLYAGCAQAHVPMLLASALLSERSARRFERFPALLRAALAANVHVAAQSEADAARYVALGVPPHRVAVTGNIKFDRALPEDWQVRGARLRARVAGDRPVWVAGSTHAGEEDAVLTALRGLQTVGLRPLLIIAPRHAPRFDAVAQLIDAQGWRWQRRSQYATDAHAAPHDVDVLLLDTLGELMDFYATADVAFVGGSLVPIGGHNLLEPAQLGVPVIAGTHLFNGADIARHLVECGALVLVRDSDELHAALRVWLGDEAARRLAGEAARAAVTANRGAARRIVAQVEALL